MPNFNEGFPSPVDNIPVNNNENEDIDSEDEFEEKKNKTASVNKSNGSRSGLKVGLLAGLALLGGGVKESKSAEDMFTDKKIDEAGEMIDSIKIKELGTPLGIEAEEEDLEIRIASLNQLGISIEDLEQGWIKYFNSVKDNYQGNWGDVEGRSAYTEMFLAYLNKIIKEKCGKESFVLNEIESKKVSKLFQTRASNEDQAPQTHIGQRSVVGDKIETSFIVDKSTRDKTGKIQFSTVNTNGFPFRDKDGNRLELVFKVQK